MLNENRPDHPIAGDLSYFWSAEPVISGPVTTTSVPSSASTITVTTATGQQVAALAITKDLSRNAAALGGADKIFTGTYQCLVGTTVTSSGTWSVTGEGPATIAVDSGSPVTAIPVGSACSVSEPRPDAGLPQSWAWRAPVISADVTIADATTSTVTVKNSVKRVYGRFGVTKQRSGTADAGIEYTGNWRCTLPGESWTGRYTVAAGATRQVPSRTVPLGASCAVIDEERPEHPVAGDLSYVWSGEAGISAPVTATTKPSKDSTVTVTNATLRQTGSFSVAKTLADRTEGLVDPDATFPFTWQCSKGDERIPAEPGTFRLADGESFQPIEEIPVGFDCVVSEGDHPELSHPSYSWSTTASIDGVEVTLDNGPTVDFTVGSVDARPAMAFTNTISREMGAVTMTKSSNPASGTDVAAGSTIPHTIILAGGEAGFVDDVVIDDDVSGLNGDGTVNVASITLSTGSATISEDGSTTGRGEADPTCRDECDTTHPTPIVFELVSPSVIVNAPANPMTPAVPPEQVSPDLAHTGTEVTPTLALALAFLLGGVGLVVLGRLSRRQREG